MSSASPNVMRREHAKRRLSRPFHLLAGNAGCLFDDLEEPADAHVISNRLPVLRGKGSCSPSSPYLGERSGHDRVGARRNAHAVDVHARGPVHAARDGHRSHVLRPRKVLACHDTRAERLVEPASEPQLDELLVVQAVAALGRLVVIERVEVFAEPPAVRRATGGGRGAGAVASWRAGPETRAGGRRA
jgi:hypothetical protein